MRRELHHWFTDRLNREMHVAVYGHYGPALLLIPSWSSDYLEFERREIIHALSPMLEAGKCKIYSVNSIMGECWLNDQMPNHWKGIRHHQYNEYLIREVVPFIHMDCNGPGVPIYTSGVSLGATASANLFFKYPDFFAGTLSLSGSYDIAAFTKGYFDEYVHDNSPVRYLSKESDKATLEKYRNKQILLATGQGEWEKPEYMKHLDSILTGLDIPHVFELWGEDMPHDWSTWQKMYPYFIEKYINPS